MFHVKHDSFSNTRDPGGYFPMQKSRKMTSNRSSTSTRPVIRPRLRMASRRSSEKSSGCDIWEARRRCASASSNPRRCRARVIIGASRPEQVVENVKASGVTIPAELLGRIDDVLGGAVERDPSHTSTRSPRTREA